MIICLGLFLVPKENLWSKTSLENCCTSTEMSDCCKTDENSNHEKSKDGKHCNDDCCSTCSVCHTFVENSFTKNNFWEIPTFESISKFQFEYADPFIPNSLQEIWQPPKLG